MVKYLAGFDPGHLHWNGLDLLERHRHTPKTDMRMHLDDAFNRGFWGVRDGLPWDHNTVERLNTVPNGFQDKVIWDIVHFHKPPTENELKRHLHEIEVNIPENASVVGVCEPGDEGNVSTMSREEGIGLAAYIHTYLRSHRKNIRLFSCDTLHNHNDSSFESNHILADMGLLDVIGFNYYPHFAHAPIEDLIGQLQHRLGHYNLPFALMETGWHDGYSHTQGAYQHMNDRREWWGYVKDVSERFNLEFVCWYPFYDTWAWDGSDTLWANGFPMQHVSER